MDRERVSVTAAVVSAVCAVVCLPATLYCAWTVYQTRRASSDAPPVTATSDGYSFVALVLAVAITLLVVTVISFVIYRRTKPSTGALSPALTPMRVLERYHMALASLRQHVGRLRQQEEVGGSVPAGALIDIGIAVDKMREELIDLTPQVFNTSEILDFREKPPEENGMAGLSENRVPKEIEHLMATVLKHWSSRGEAVGITPLRFKNSPIVKLDHL